MTKKRSKKNKKNEETLDQNEVELVEDKIPETEPASDEIEAVVVDADPVEDDDTSSKMDEPVEEVQLEVEDEFSPDDLLDDVRRSLIEENAQIEEEKKPSWWQKLGGGRPKTKDTEDIEPAVDASLEEDIDSIIAEIEEVEQDDAGESIDDLIEILETEDEISPVEMDVETTTPQIEEKQPKIEKVDVDELKKRAFKGRTSEDKEENFSDVRSVALEGGEEVFVEVEVKTEDPVQDRIKSFENALRPYRSYIYFGIAFIGIVVIVATSALLYGAYQRSLPPEPVQEVSNLPYPVVLDIPGGLSFNLGRGSLVNGRWNPQRPEWLEGTEVCRWVAIKYSRQLEAVIRTLTRDDKLTLTMSNSDVISYDVFSITQMTIEDMQEVSSNTPCLLLVLADENTDTRWVVTAYP